MWLSITFGSVTSARANETQSAITHDTSSLAVFIAAS
jgi:hypothetical protein